MMRRRLGETEWATHGAVARTWLRKTIGPTPTPTTLGTTALLAVGIRPS